MNPVFVDTNVFMRFFTLDEKGQHARAARLFRRAAQGALTLVTGPPVLFEICWTLRSAYGLSRDKALNVLCRIAAMPGLEMVDRPVVEEALRLAGKSRQDFADAYIVASAAAHSADAVATFNRKHFEKLGARIHRL